MNDYENAVAFLEKALILYEKDAERYEEKITEIQEVLERLSSK